jgi:hypothetical protein
LCRTSELSTLWVYRSGCRLASRGSYGICLQVVARRLTEAWHQLSQEEQQRLLGLGRQALDTAGGKTLVICSAAWSNERWPFFGVEEFPDMEAVQRHTQLLSEFNWDATGTAAPRWAPSLCFRVRLPSRAN